MFARRLFVVSFLPEIYLSIYLSNATSLRDVSYLYECRVYLS